MKKFDLFEDLKLFEEFHRLLNFNFIVIYMIHKIAVSI